MTNYNCDRCGKPVDQPRHQRVVGSDEPFTSWANRFGWTPPFDGAATALRTHVNIAINAPGVDETLELCPRCFADLTVAALRTLDEETRGEPVEPGRVAVTPDVRMVALLNPAAAPTRRCACESARCHEHGDCRTSATVQVEAFGILQSLCDRCAVTAVIADVLRTIGAR